jgi:hypothetical protein
MAIQLTTTHAQPEEGFLHYIAREGRVFLRWTIGICIIAIVGCMVSPGFFFVAVIPALLMLAAFVLLVLANEVERRSDTVAHDALERTEKATINDLIENHAEDDQLPAATAHLVRREGRTGIVILVSAMVVAVMIAFIMFDFRLFAIGALVIFAYMLLISAPLWLGWFNDDIEDESRRMEGLPESAAVKTH